jgi:hypothetical protein
MIIPTCSSMLVYFQHVFLCSTHDRNDLDGTKPEFEFTEKLDTEVVDGADGNQENCNPDAWIDFVFALPF